MSIIYLEGKVDKRILAFPIMRVCSMDGPTLVVTDDGLFQNLYFQTGNKGTISGVDIIVIHDFLDAYKEEKEGMYKHIIYVSSDLMPINKELDIHVHFKSYNGSVIRSEFELLDEEDVSSNRIDIVVSMTPLKGVKKALILRPEYYRYLSEIEEKKELIITKDRQLRSLISILLCSSFQIKPSQFASLFVRKKYEV